MKGWSDAHVGSKTHIALASAVAPADLRLVVLVEHGEDNRVLDIVVDSIDYHRRDRVSSAGESAPINPLSTLAGDFTLRHWE